MIETYRDYDISFSNGWFIARPLDNEPFEIRCLNAGRLRKAIDALWDALKYDLKSDIDALPLPRWLRKWLADPVGVIDLDVAYASGGC